MTVSLLPQRNVDILITQARFEPVISDSDYAFRYIWIEHTTNVTGSCLKHFDFQLETFTYN
jgi:hypothetical protein